MEPVIQVILLKNQEYLIAQIEEREESPECLLTNPYRITDLTYWDYSNMDTTHVPTENAVFVSSSVEKEKGKDGEDVIVTQSDYILIEKFPKYTTQSQIYLRSNDILTICDPGHLVLECYKRTVG